MRILLINQYYKPDTAATGQLLADVAEELAQRGHEVHVLCSQKSYNSEKITLTAHEKMNGVFIHRVKASGFRRNIRLGRMANYLTFLILATWKVLLLSKMDICICLTTPPYISLVGLWLRIFKKTRLVVWTMDLYPDLAVALEVIKKGGCLHRILTWLNKYIYKTSSCVISLGEVMTDHLVKAGVSQSKIITVDNWVPGEGDFTSDMPLRPVS